jgi:raffinose/stachyose/melibiose transport system substrate-binding protein
MKKLTICLLACVVLLAGAVVAFAGAGTGEAAAAKPVSFVYATFIGTDKDQVGCTIEAYRKMHPNVTIEYQMTDAATMLQKYTVQLASNTMPDMFWWNAIYLSKGLVSNPESMVDLTPYFDPAFKSKFIDGTWNLLATKDGKIAGFPAEMQVQAWMFNKALFDKYGLKIPTTYDELKACVPVFKKNGIVTIAAGTADPWPTWGFYHWYQLWGIDDQAQQLFAKQSIKTADAGYANAFKAIAELAALGAFPENNSTIRFEAMVQMFLAGQAAMITLPSDQLGKIVGQPIEKDLVYNWGVKFANSPYSQEQGIKMVGNGFGIGANVAKDPEKLKAIIDFNKWRYSDEAFAITLDKGFILPVKAKYDVAKLSPVNRQQAQLIGDNRKGTITAVYAPYIVWKWDVNLITDYYNVEDNLLNSLLNGSMTAANLPAEFAKIDATVANAITTLGLK